MDNTNEQTIAMPQSSQGILSTVLRYVQNPLYIGLAILFLLSAGTSTYILFASSPAPVTPIPSSKPQTLVALSTPAPTPQATLIPSPTGAPAVSSSPTLTPTPAMSTANWLTYTNTSYGYSMKYPSDWVASDEGTLEPLIPSYVVFQPASAPSRAVAISYTTRTSSQLAAIYGSSGTQMTVDNFSATEYQARDSDGNQSVDVVLPLGVNALIFYAVIQYQDTLNQMLGTFQLTN